MELEKKPILNLDPRTKIVLLLGVNIFVFTNSYIEAEAGIILGLTALLVMSGIGKAGLKDACLYVIFLVIQYFILPLCPKVLISSLTILVITCRKLLPCVMLGTLLVKTTPIRLLMHALQKWHIPQSVIIPLAITIRYFPTLGEERQAISDAMKLRNVHGIIRKIQYVFVPLMMSASSTADELSQALTARGIDNPKPKTCTDDLRLGPIDYLFFLVAIGLCSLAFILN